MLNAGISKIYCTICIHDFNILICTDTKDLLEYGVTGYNMITPVRGTERVLHLQSSRRHKTVCTSVQYMRDTSTALQIL